MTMTMSIGRKLCPTISTILVTVGLLAFDSRPVAAQTTSLVSITADNIQGNSQSREPSISADGRFVCFESRANNLVPGDSNGKWDVFVKDMQTGEIIRVSQNSQGEVANDFSTMAVISADASIVAFMSAATNLVPNDTNNDWDFFVHDLTTRETTRVSVNSSGEQANGGANCNCRVYKFPGVSDNGRFIAFHSSADNLVDDDTNGVFDVFRHDRLTGETIRISKSTAGAEADAHCWIRDMSLSGRFIVYHTSASTLVPDDNNGLRDIFLYDHKTRTTERINIPVGGGETDDISDSPRVSRDGRFVAYASLATNLVPGDTNGQWDVFLRDRRLGTTSRISVSSKGIQGDIFSRHPSISANGRWITFHSVTTNLVPGDTNGHRDIMLHDRFTAETTRISVSSLGEQSNERSFDGFISPDGQWVVYDSAASNLVAGDNNNNRDIFRYHRFGDNLTLSGPSPATAGDLNRWQLEFGSPGATVQLLYSQQLAGANMSGCPGMSLDLDRPTIVDQVSVRAGGVVVFKRFIPGKAAGKTIYFQAWEPGSCRKSNVLVVTFP